MSFGPVVKISDEPVCLGYHDQLLRETKTLRCFFRLFIYFPDMAIAVGGFDYLCRLCAAKTGILMGLPIFEAGERLRNIDKKIAVCLPVQVRHFLHSIFTKKLRYFD